ncbi:MAG: hypothetical protein KGJ95_10450 [Candidatus Omnitrophica bacterium]|nr:hypothetical protein [Candidatus Omnitrophota bacterium]
MCEAVFSEQWRDEVKLNLGLTAEEELSEYRDKYSEWHRFFAIWPRNVGRNDWRFLETIERRLCVYGVTGVFDTWKYRGIK